MCARAHRIAALLIVVVGLAPGGAAAQSTLTNYRHYRMSDGLPADKVTCLYEAPDGHLWVGTNGGLCRFDGRAFTALPVAPGALPVEHITALHAPSDTLLMIGTLRGLALYDLRTGRFLNDRLNDDRLKPGTGQEVTAIAPLPRGHSLVVAGEQLAVLDARGLMLRARRAVSDLNARVFLAAPPCFLDSDSTNMLVHVLHAGFFRLDLSTLALTPAVAPYAEGAVAAYPDDHYITAQRMTGGGLLFGSYWGHFLYRDADGGERARFAPPAGQPGGMPAHPTRMVHDPLDPTVHWVATQYGLRRFNARMRTLETFVLSGNGADPAALNVFNDLVIDRHGQEWLASNAGLIKIAKLTWSVQDLLAHGPAELRNADLSHAVTDGADGLLVATFDRGIVALAQGKPARNVADHTVATPGAARITFELRRIDGELYAATDRGILRYNAGAGRFEATGWIPDTLLRNGASAVCVHRDAHGDTWCGVGAGGGLVRIHADGHRTVYDHYHHAPGSPQYLPIRYPRVIAEDAQGDLWMGLPRLEGMLVRWQRSTGRFDTVPVRLPEVELLRVAITDLHFDAEQHLWACTHSHGVLRRDARTGTWTRYGVREGLRSNDVACSAFDVKGNLWVGTYNGIAVLPCGEQRFRAFSMEDGLPHAMVNWIGFPFPDHPERLVITGTGHVQALDAGRLLQARAPLRVTIDRTDVEGSPEAMQDGDRFPHDRSHFVFHFAAVNLVNGPDDRYAYMLEGLDADWIAAGDQRSATYANLPPGSYVFRVKVGNAGMGWSQPTSIAFTVEAPFWKRAWFMGLVVLACAAIAYAIHRVRVQRLFALERVRASISRDLHDDIGSTLSSVNMLAHATRSRLQDADPRKAEEALGRIGERTQRMLDTMQDIIWSIKPENDALPHVLARMREFAAGTLEASGIGHDLHFPANAEGVQLPLVLKNNLYLVFKEAVNNLAKYSGATHARIELTLKDRTLRLVVQDNGRGFDPAAPVRGNGLENMQRRAAECGARLTVTSAPGTGTRVELLMPRIP